MSGREDGEVGFEEAMSWLPSHIVDEAICDSNKVVLFYCMNIMYIYVYMHVIYKLFQYLCLVLVTIAG